MQSGDGSYKEFLGCPKNADPSCRSSGKHWRIINVKLTVKEPSGIAAKVRLSFFSDSLQAVNSRSRRGIIFPEHEHAPDKIIILVIQEPVKKSFIRKQ